MGRGAGRRVGNDVLDAEGTPAKMLNLGGATTV